MPDHPPPEFLHRVSQSLSLSPQTTTVAMIVLGIVLVFSLGVVLQVMIISREKKLSLRAAARHGAAAVWAVPVLAVLGLFAYRVSQVQQPSPPPDARIFRAGELDPPAEAAAGMPKLEPQEPAPPWAQDATLRRSNRVVTIVLHHSAATREIAERELAAAVRELLRGEYPGEFGGAALGRISPELVKRHLLARPPAVRKWRESVSLQTFDGEKPTAARDASQTIPQVYWQVDLSEERRAALKAAMVAPRLWTVGAGVGLLALIFAAVAVYFRLDAATDGRYRTRLKLATTSLLTAAGLLATALLPLR